jgi:hypothetical protein
MTISFQTGRCWKNCSPHSSTTPHLCSAPVPGGHPRREEAERERLRKLPFEEKILLVEKMRKHLEPSSTVMTKTAGSCRRRLSSPGKPAQIGEEGLQVVLPLPNGRKVYFNTKEEGDALLDAEIG